MALDFILLNSPKTRIVLITVKIAEQLGKQARTQLQAHFIGPKLNPDTHLENIFLFTSIVGRVTASNI